jgi:hypothetical protein
LKGGPISVASKVSDTEAHFAFLEVWVTKGGEPVAGAEVSLGSGRKALDLPATDVDGYTALTFVSDTPVRKLKVKAAHKGDATDFDQDAD